MLHNHNLRGVGGDDVINEFKVKLIFIRLLPEIKVDAISIYPSNYLSALILSFTFELKIIDL